MYKLEVILSARPSPDTWDLVSGLLYQFHSQGIEEGEEPPPHDKSALAAANEFELALEPGILAPPQRWAAYFDNLRDANRAQRAIEPVLAHLNPIYEITEVIEKNYLEIWKENFQPLHLPPYWLIRTPWHTEAPQHGEIELIIEPGMAFGTGSHETTRTCLELLAQACKSHGLGPQSQTLDFGSGSGILAIALKKLGIGVVHAVDIDPLTLEAIDKNAKLNHVEIKASLQIPSFEGAVFGNANGVDGIVANILKNTLLDHAESFWLWLNRGGFLILSGLLVEQEMSILEKYSTLGFHLEKRLVLNQWISLWLSKPASH